MATVQTPRILVRVSKDRGDGWSDAAVLSDSAKAAGFPVVAASRERMTVAWSEQDAVQAAHAEAGHVDMKDPKAVMPLGAELKSGPVCWGHGDKGHMSFVGAPRHFVRGTGPIVPTIIPALLTRP